MKDLSDKNSAATTVTSKQNSTYLTAEPLPVQRGPNRYLEEEEEEEEEEEGRKRRW